MSSAACSCPAFGVVGWVNAEGPRSRRAFGLAPLLASAPLSTILWVASATKPIPELFSGTPNAFNATDAMFPGSTPFVVP